jgi:hypothetical protein
MARLNISLRMCAVIGLLAVLSLAQPALAQQGERGGGGRDPASERGGQDRDRPERDRPDTGGRDRAERGGGERGGGPASFDVIKLTNACRAPIYVAVAYFDGGRTIARGWWPVQPGDTVTTDARSTAKSVYFFAFDPSDRGEWNGLDERGSVRPDALSVWIVNGTFAATPGELERSNGSRRVAFFKRATGDTYGTVTQRFTCGG